jgi:hypothetical protein
MNVRLPLASFAILGCIIIDSSTLAVRADDRTIDEAKVRAAGIRKLESRRLTLYTDVPSLPDVDELPLVFDRAFDLWCRYFSIDPARHADWHMRASLIDRPERFRACDLMPADLPKFLNGFTQGHDFWLYNQTSPYYRRHLLLHEGVHGIMFSLVGSNAPPWYIEGMAELLATHRWQDGRLELPYFPTSPIDVPKLGRIEIIQTDFAKRQAKRFSDVLAYDQKAHLTVEPYGWSWAATAFLNGHPRYRDRFHQLLSVLKRPGDFNAKLRETYADDFDHLAEEWQVFVADIDFGYDFERTMIDFAPGRPIGRREHAVSVAADRGWQNSGIQLEVGKTYRLAAQGEFQVADEPKPWISEPSGVSIHYIHGKPLGVLLAAVRPEITANQTSGFMKPIVVGAGTEIRPSETGTLYFKINDSAGQLSDNSGKVEVIIRAD